MANDVLADSGDGAGAKFATDDVGGKHYPLTKIAFGIDDTATWVSTTNPYPVELTDNNQTVVADVGSIKTAVEILDNAISGSEMQVDVVTSALPSGASTSANQSTGNTSLAAIQTAVEIIDDAVAAEAGALGKGILLQGDDGTDRKNINVDATTGDVQVDVTNTVTVDGSGVTQPVSGTVTANLSATDNAVLDAIETDTTVIAGDTTSIDGKITACDTGAVVLAAGSAAIGKLAANSGVDIGDVDVTSVIPGTSATSLGKAEDAAHSSGDTGVMSLAVRKAADGPHSGADGDYEPLQTDANGFLKVNIKAGAGSGGTASTDDAAFTAGAGAGTPAMGFFSADTVDAGDVGVLAMDASRRLLCSIEVDNVGIGGGTQYSVDDAGPTVVTMAGAVRDDSLTTLTEVDGDATLLRVSSTGALHVTGGGGGTEYTEDAAAANPIVGTATVMERDDALSALTPIEGDWASFRCSAEGALWTQDFNSDGILADTTAIKTAVELLDNAVDGNYLNANINLAGTDVTAGAGAVAAGTPRVTLGSDDPAVALLGTMDTDTGVIAGDTTSIDGKIIACNTGAVVLAAGSAAIGKLAANSGVDIGDVDVLSLPGVAGDVAHDSADSGNPVKTGSKAKSFDGTAPGTAAAEDDRVDNIADVYGRPFVETAHPNHWDVSADYGAAQTNVTIKAAPGAGLKLYITDIIVSNGATAGNITLLDGSGGTVKLELYPAINGGLTIPLRTPITLTANTLLAITSTTVTTHSVTICGYTAP